jgi:SpoVK/Ycf46/Vps4 family AAA+-type ATPase
MVPHAFADDAAYVEAQIERLNALLGGDRARAAELGRSIAKRVDATQTPLGFETLRRRFGLDDIDADTLLLAAAASLDPALQKTFTRLSGTPFHPWLDVGIAIALHHDGVADRLRARARFQPEAPLVKSRLITLDRSRPDAKDNLLACEIKLPPRILRAMLGTDPTGGTTAYARLLAPEAELADVVLSDAARADLEQLLGAQPRLSERLSAWGYATSGRAVTVLVVGAPGTGKTMLGLALAKRLGKQALVVEAPRLLEAGRALESEIDELLVEARLKDAVVLFDDCEPLFARNQSRLQAIYRALDRFEGLVVLTASAPERLDSTLDRRVLLRVGLEVPGAPARDRIWQRLLGNGVPRAADVDIAQLAKRYELSGGQMKSAALLAASKAVARGAGAEVTMADLDSAAQAQLRGDLSAYAERTRGTTLSLAALVLPDDEKAQIEEIISAGRVRNMVLHQWGFSEKLPTGKGLVVLFSGEPGTGKTLAAEVIAAELDLHLYRVNPAKVVSKFVGETEKNLNEILAQAKSTRSILFFDEADALFSTRVAKVETANDRFVNMETNFLLQQLERYEGIVILATNLETSIDQAFKRRIAYHVVIPFPKPPDRERIWRTLIPARAPKGDIDYPRLARNFELSGGHIKNAILRAAYIAASKDRPLDYELLAAAAEHECAAAGKLFRAT